MCAEAYARSDGKKQLVIGKISKNSFLIKARQNTLQENIDNLYSALIQIDQDPANIFEQLKASLKEKKPISEQSFLVIKALNRISTMTNEILSNTFSQTIQQSIKKNITEVYGVSFPQEESFWRNVGSAFLLANLYKDNKKTAGVRYSLQTIIKKNYPRSLYLYKKLLSKLKVPIEHNDYCYLPFFVLMSQSAEKIESIKYNAIILTHGKSTAASIQQVVNSLCGNFLFEAFDMPLDISINEINSYVQEYLNKQSSSTNGNIILFDMGSLGQMFREIKKISNQELLVINDVSTAMALDIGLRIQRNEAFQTIAENSQKYGLTTKAQYYEGLSNKKNNHSLLYVWCRSFRRIEKIDRNDSFKLA
ncbi:hypothetical protein Q757_02375 [Oenococcus alcoholitolerans]|uniref:PTS EIIA type-4 domain-containing protein n=1 Tax=Oenococcus alcoholitolerans TaxID=931074 RepID=A0ABR4XRV7_9LACO|nr:hypothetical protein Q757_02375 [Oenococcus alcoholitolerans]